MRIGIDINEANVVKRVGVSEFAFELVREFQKYQSEQLRFELYSKKQPTSDFPESTSTWKYHVFGPKKLWTQLALPARLFLQQNKSDVFFTPSHYAPRFAPCPTVISIMDVAYAHFPQLFAKKDLYQLQEWTKYSVKKASAIITISEASKRDILNTYQLSDSDVYVVYPGIRELKVNNEKLKMSMSDITPHIYNLQELQEKYNIKGKYLLFVSTLQPRKNIARLIEAFAQLKDVKDHQLQLVIVGKKGWLYEEILAAPQKFGVTDDVLFLNFVTNEELSVLYQHAQAFVFPSLYEGFGLSILEAMQHGCPVITSDVSSMPEAGGDAALYVDPNNTESITKAMEKLLREPHLRKELIVKGKEQVKKFSWAKAAKETLDILEQIGSR